MTILLAGVVLLLLMAQLGSFFAAFAGHEAITHERRNFHEVVVEDNNSRNKIAVIDVVGIITDAAFDVQGRNLVTWIKDQLERAGEDRAVKAVLLKVDSPGGEVLASDEIYRALASFQSRTGKPVVAAMGGVAASGGYYVAAPCRWIVANELTITGSIGVIMQTYNYRGLMDKVGVRPEVFKSGKFKDMMSASRREEDISSEEREMVQGLVNETFARFRTVVAEGRKWAGQQNLSDGRRLSDEWQDYTDGRVFSGKQAFELGFVDELGNFDVAVERARTLAGVEHANLIRYHEPFDLANLFRLFGKSETATVKIDLGLDAPRIQAGRLYFLSPTFLR